MDVIDNLFNNDSSHIDILYDRTFLDKIENKAISYLIKEYYKIPKKDFSNRVDFLSKFLIEINDGYKRERSIILKKINYLNKLILLYQNKVLIKNSKDIYNYDYFYNNYIKSKNSEGIELKNKLYWDDYNKKFAGNYFLEIIDPAHRELVSYKQKWDELSINEDFFVFLEIFSVTKKEKTFIFFNDYELKKRKLIINENKCKVFLKNKYILLDTSLYNDECLFTIDLNSNIFCFFQEKNKYNHISSSRGKPILGAGLIKAKEGIITEIGVVTGHYLIEKDKVRQILKIFISKGIPLSNEIKISFFDNNILSTEKITSYL